MKIKPYVFYIILAVLVVVFLISAFYVSRYVLDARTQESRYDNLAAIVEEAKKGEPEETAPTEGEDAETATSPGILPEYRELYEMNSDMVGWLQIPGTNVNYPVMQTPHSEDYYLYRNFDREYNVHGCLYAREECDVYTPSDNITIYGHHMIDGSMFADLDLYQKKSFWEEHTTLQFDTLTARHSYEIFAVFKTTASVGEGFSYHSFVTADSEGDFDSFIATCKKLSFYDTGITPEYGDKIICLSTCEYTQENGRLVVAAVRTN